MFASIKRGIHSAKRAVTGAYDKAKGVSMAILGTLASAVTLSSPKLSYAAGPDLSTLTAAVDFGTVTTAILGVAAALIVVYIAWKGAKMVLAAVRGG